MKAEKILESKGREVYSIHVDAIVNDALQVMSEKNIGALIVLDGQRNVQGIVSERDVMRSCHRSQPLQHGHGPRPGSFRRIRLRLRLYGLQPPLSPGPDRVLP